MEVEEKAPAAAGGSASPYVSQIMAPGDIVLDLTKSGKVLRLGGGLRQDGDSIMVTKAGRLQYMKPNKYWVEGSQKRYIPSVEDVVIGIVVDRRFETFSVDIGGPTHAALPILAFEGATRRNIPNLQIGSALYARVVNAHRDSDPELSCTDAPFTSPTIIAGAEHRAIFDMSQINLGQQSCRVGPLKGGYIFECSTGLSRGLLSQPTCPVLEALGKNLSYEIAVGMNGRVWVNSASPATTILVSNAILNAEFLTTTQQANNGPKALAKNTIELLFTL